LPVTKKLSSICRKQVPGGNCFLAGF